MLHCDPPEIPTGSGAFQRGREANYRGISISSDVNRSRYVGSLGEIIVESQDGLAASGAALKAAASAHGGLLIDRRSICCFDVGFFDLE